MTSPGPQRTAAGSVAEVFTTTRSPGSSRPGRSVNGWWLISPVRRRLTSIRTASLGIPRASGGSLASSAGGSSKPASAVMTAPSRRARVPRPARPPLRPRGRRPA